jgi:hypothetical protein
VAHGRGRASPSSRSMHRRRSNPRSKVASDSQRGGCGGCWRVSRRRELTSGDLPPSWRKGEVESPKLRVASVHRTRTMLAPVRHLTLRGSWLLRATLLASLSGHWVANAIFDRDEYGGASPEVISRLHDPALVQTGIALVILLILTAWDRRRTCRGQDHFLAGLGRLQLVWVFLGVQVLLFVGMETSERIAIEAFSAVSTGVEPIGAGFIPELLVAIGSVLLLSVLGETTARIVASLRSRRSSRLVPLHRRLPLGGSVRRRCVLIGAGAVRAPPRPAL